MATRSTLFSISMIEVAFLLDSCLLCRRSRTFDTAEELAEHYELQKLLRSERPDWPEDDYMQRRERKRPNHPR